MHPWDIAWETGGGVEVIFSIVGHFVDFCFLPEFRRTVLLRVGQGPGLGFGF